LHELTLVDGILRAVEATAKERGKRVSEVTVSVGELAQFDTRIVKGLLNDLKRATPLHDAKVTVRTEKARVKCMTCGNEFTFRDLAPSLTGESKEVIHFLPELIGSYFNCPRCSKSFFEIEGGRSVSISEIRFDG
jgi:hydrogenase nickel incorporation protein HypA/HybF